MREKDEREALPRASGAIRLTEYEPGRKNSFVNCLDKETTPFFFTNFPEDVQVVELWSLFAKHGRVGEVYVPNKRDKRGQRFGFVKFKDVKNIEALNDRLGDVWMGSFKLKVNLALFGRNGKRESPSQHRFGGENEKRKGGDLEKRKEVVVPVVGGNKVITAKPFKAALLGDAKGKEKPEQPPSLEGIVAPEMMVMLEGSYMGRVA
jgi:RNA recognition motif-containing protein